MDWQTLNSDALKALMEGDRSTAISSWKVAVEMVEAANLPPTAELGRLYYCLGKCYFDEGLQKDALRFIGRAEKILLEVAPEHPELKKIQYDLGGLLLKLGQKEAASSAFAGGRSIEPIADCLRGAVEPDLPVEDALALLQKNGLALELNADLREELSREIEADGYGGCTSFVELADLLYCYYQKDYRCERDKVLRMRDFDSLPDLALAELIDRFNNFTGSVIVGCDEIISYETDSCKQYFVAPKVNAAQEPMFPLTGSCSLVHLYNCRLRDRGSKWRILNLLCEAGPWFIVLPYKVAVDLYMQGVGNIFDCLSQDLEPPELV